MRILHRAGAYSHVCHAGDNAKRFVGMLLPKGAVEDLLQELNNQQVAAEAQQAQQMQDPHSEYLHPDSRASQPANHVHRGADDVQQLNSFQARLHSGFGHAKAKS